MQLVLWILLHQLLLLLLPLPVKIVANFVLAIDCCYVFQSCCSHCTVTVTAFVSCCIFCSWLLFGIAAGGLLLLLSHVLSFCCSLILGAFVSIALFGQYHHKVDYCTIVTSKVPLWKINLPNEMFATVEGNSTMNVDFQLQCYSTAWLLYGLWLWNDFIAKSWRKSSQCHWPGNQVDM